MTKNSESKDDPASPEGAPRNAARDTMHTASSRTGTPARAGQAAEPRDRSAEWLGRSLRQLYDGTAREPIPDKFRALLDQLDERDKTSGKDSKE